MKDKLPKPIKQLIKPIYYMMARFHLIIRRKRRKILVKLFGAKEVPHYTFAILCIKKTEYADMAVVNINSLHSLNTLHSFVLYCDTVCANYLKTNIGKFDYPDRVKILDKYATVSKPWQYFKIEVHIEAAKNNQIDTDADGIWHDDPVLDRTKITMLAHAHNFKDRPAEVSTLVNLFPNKNEWLSYRHCVAAFLSMPPKYMTEDVAKKMRDINNTICSSSLSFLTDEKVRGEARRLSEEFAVNLAIQSTYPQEDLVVLKEKDGWGNKNILQSLYYGCDNKINE